MAASIVRDLRLSLMLNKFNRVDLLIDFTKASELKALSNIAPMIFTLLAACGGRHIDGEIQNCMRFPRRT